MHANIWVPALHMYVCHYLATHKSKYVAKQPCTPLQGADVPIQCTQVRSYTCIKLRSYNYSYIRTYICTYSTLLDDVGWVAIWVSSTCLSLRAGYTYIRTYVDFNEGCTSCTNQKFRAITINYNKHTASVVT